MAWWAMPTLQIKHDRLSTINYQLSTINYQLSTINYQLSTINYQLSTINYQLLKTAAKSANRYYTNGEYHQFGVEP